MNQFRKTILTKQGMALAIVLPLLVLLALVVTVFLSRALLERKIAASSTAQVRTALLGQSALDWVTADMQAEIRAGSTEVSPGVGVYEPSSAQTAVPQRVGTSTNLPNLVKTSSTNAPPFGGSGYNGTISPQCIAVAAGTDAADLNGIKMNPARWNKPLLMSATNGFVAPDWVLLTRKGPKAFQSYDAKMANRRDVTNDDLVVGRFAYAIYDVGGLLDINVAGAPSAVQADDRGRRGPSALADLTQVGLSESQIDTLVGWRNRLTLNASGAFPSYTFGAGADKKYLDYVTKAPGGFVIPPYDEASQKSDQRFLSRQDLLAFQKSNPTLLPAASLPFLTTFSRSLSPPSWRPLQNAVDLQVAADSRGAITNGAGNIYAYKDNATKVDAQGVPTSVNPDFRLLKVLRPFIRIDGSIANVDELLLKRRFPLSRLAWVGSNGPAGGGSADQVKKAFGLSWDGVQNIWVYTSPDATTVRVIIKTLNEVANPTSGNPREPDFFELLKAGILDGSVGLSPDVPTFTDTMQMDVSKERQIIQIGANVIDQFDADSYPTVVQFRWPSIQSDPDYEEVAGIESLPYFAGMIPMVFRREGDAQTEKFVHIYYVPRLWNPHQNASLAPAGQVPGEIRVIARRGISGFTVQNWRNNVWRVTDVPVNYQLVPQWVTIDQSKFGSFDNVQVLQSANSNASSGVGEIQLSQTAKVLRVADYNGFYGGRADMYAPQYEFPPPKPGNTNPAAENYWSYWIDEKLDANGDALSLEMQFKSAGNQWKTYQLLPGAIMRNSINGVAGKYVNPNPDAFNWDTYQYPNYARIDPRGVRFGLPEYDRGTNREALTNSTYPTLTGGGRTSHGYRLSNGVALNYNNPTPLTKRIPLDPAPTVAPEEQFFYPFCWSDKAGNAPNTPFVSTVASTKASLFGDNTLPPNMASPEAVQRGPSYYLDRDLIRRGGDARLPHTASAANPMVNPMASTRAGGLGKVTDRPLILNRPFLNVAELGYVFRDLPWKTLDFSTAKSADAGLLDLFDVSESDADIVAGRVNLNTRQAPVLQALLAGALKDEMDAGKLAISATDAASIAAATVTASSASPLRNISEVATIVMPGTASAANEPVKTRKEAVARALAAGGTTTEWNLLIDLVAQSGRFIDRSKTLENFLVEGEKRYWLHIAIDRQTGRIIDEQLEAVYE